MRSVGLFPKWEVAPLSTQFGSMTMLQTFSNHSMFALMHDGDTTVLKPVKLSWQPIGEEVVCSMQPVTTSVNIIMFDFATGAIHGMCSSSATELQVPLGSVSSGACLYSWGFCQLSARGVVPSALKLHDILPRAQLADGMHEAHRIHRLFSGVPIKDETVMKRIKVCWGRVSGSP